MAQTICLWSSPANSIWSDWMDLTKRKDGTFSLKFKRNVEGETWHMHRVDRIRSPEQIFDAINSYGDLLMDQPETTEFTIDFFTSIEALDPPFAAAVKTYWEVEYNDGETFEGLVEETAKPTTKIQASPPPPAELVFIDQIDVLKLDPLTRDKTIHLPSAAQKMHVCSYYVNIGIDNVDESLYLHRGSGNDVLSVTGDLGWGGIIEVQGLQDYDDRTVAANLLKELLIARVGIGWPSQFGSFGLLSQEDYQKVVSHVEGLLKRQESKATELAQKSPIYERLSAVGFTPEWSGKGTHFRAPCLSGRSHLMQVNCEINRFYCGYCKISGGPEDIERTRRSKK